MTSVQTKPSLPTFIAESAKEAFHLYFEPLYEWFEAWSLTFREGGGLQAIFQSFSGEGKTRPRTVDPLPSDGPNREQSGDAPPEDDTSAIASSGPWKRFPRLPKVEVQLQPHELPDAL
jgi:hypothetical protein